MDGGLSSGMSSLFMPDVQISGSPSFFPDSGSNIPIQFTEILHFVDPDEGSDDNPAPDLIPADPCPHHPTKTTRNIP